MLLSVVKSYYYNYYYNIYIMLYMCTLVSCFYVKFLTSLLNRGIFLGTTTILDSCRFQPTLLTGLIMIDTVMICQFNTLLAFVLAYKIQLFNYLEYYYSNKFMTFSEKMKFTNYLFNKVESKFMAHNLFTHPEKEHRNMYYEFSFSLKPDQNKILDQAEAFGKYYTIGSQLFNSKMESDYKVEDINELLRDAYVYSYIKCVYLACKQVNSGTMLLNRPNFNIVFHGHKLLYDYIMFGTVNFQSTKNSTISMQINDLKRVQKEIEDFDLFKQYYDKDFDIFIIQKLELLLQYLGSKRSDTLALSNIGHNYHNSCLNMISNPLGNCCYADKEFKVLNFVEIPGITTDKLSLFWNKANLVTSILVPYIDYDDKVYETVETKHIHKLNVALEVQSITGYNPLTGWKSVTDMPIAPSSNNDSNPSGGSNVDRGPNSPKDNKSWKERNNKVKDKKVSPKQDKDQTSMSRSRFGEAAEKISKISGKALKLLSSKDQLLTESNIDTIADLLQVITGHTINQHKLRKHFNEPLVNVYSNYGLPVQYDFSRNKVLYLKHTDNKIVVDDVLTSTELVENK